MKIKNIIANIIIVILCIVVVITGVSAIRSYNDTMNGYFGKESSLIDELQWGDFEGLLERAARVEVNNQKLSVNGKECIAVAKYYDAAVYYKMYVENNEAEKAEKKLQIMEEQREAAGELEYLTDEIDEMLRK